MLDVLVVTNNTTRNSPRALQITASLKKLGYDAQLLEVPDTKNQLLIAQAISRGVREKRPKVVHLLNICDYLFLPLLLLKGRYYQTLVYDIRNPWGLLLQSEFGSIAFRSVEIFERLISKRADYFTTVNELLLPRLQGYNPKAPATVIPNYPAKKFVDEVDKIKVKDLRTRFGRGNKIVLFVGKLSNVEASKILFNTIDSVRGEKVVFWIVGSGKNDLENKLKAKENVEFFGWKPREEVPNFIAAADVGIVPRLDTPISNTICEEDVWKVNEYLALGKPVVASGITICNPKVGVLGGKPEEFNNLIAKAMNGNVYVDKNRIWEDVSEKRLSRLYESILF